MNDNIKREQVQDEFPNVNETFQCPFEGCGKTFSSLAILCTHEAVCRKAGITPRASCEICGSRTSNLKQHMLLHQPPQHQCPVCKKMFHSRYNMTTHLKIHAKVQDPFGEGSNEETQLLLEMAAAPPRHQKRNTESESFPCTICDSVFMKKRSLQYHMNIHEGLTPYKCRNEGCDESFANHQDRYYHERLCRGESSTKTCTECGMQINIKGIAKHMRRAHQVLQKDRKPVAKDKLYPCGQCSAVLKSERARISHENKHNGIKPYSCRNEGCRESFAGESSRGKHEKLCRETASTCPVCGLALANWSVRQEHMAAFHKDDTVLAEMPELGLPKEDPPKKVFKEDPPKKVPITICPNVILPDGRKKCPECGEIFSQQKSFVYHMNKHKEGHPYACVKCSQTFFSKFNRTYHEKKCLAGLTVRKDSDTEPIETPKEKKQKSSKSQAYREKQCSDCGEKCVTRQHLNSHQENEHQPEEEYAELESTITIKEEKIQWDDDDDEIVGT